MQTALVSAGSYTWFPDKYSGKRLCQPECIALRAKLRRTNGPANPNGDDDAMVIKGTHKKNVHKFQRPKVSTSCVPATNYELEPGVSR
ncbi:hypothetical protein CRUP_026261 [Coryphaenoides rupestris]|nr:hypothetical protein CRUP_026261 [Coryphaenoides rupestris]